jgi:dihydropteroate synthase
MMLQAAILGSAILGSMHTNIQPNSDHHYYFVTGKLAQVAMREVVGELAGKYRFRYTIGVMPITVAALMTPRWLSRHLDVPSDATHVIVPGHLLPDCIASDASVQPADDNGLETLIAASNLPIVVGPKDCRDMAMLFGEQRKVPDLDQYSIEIIAEINHAPRRPIADVVSEAGRLVQQGADVIDFGCDPASHCAAIGDYIKALIDQGHRVSVDSFNAKEIASATKHGAELVLSVNSTNREAAADWGCEVVVIPDTPDDDIRFHETVAFLERKGIATRLDPILEPIGTGFTSSLVRYAKTRQRYPDHPMLMGIGNLTELTDVDSAGVNLLLLGICEELGIQSVLTTQVINWARSSVRECDLARRIVHYSQKHGVPPKRLSDALVILRDAKLRPYSSDSLASLATSIRDNNYRIHAQDEVIHLISAGMHLTDQDPFLLFDQLMQHEQSRNVDPNHAFYLGFEMAKASLALLLGKQYEQDESLRWGHLTKAEAPHRLKRRS